MAGKKKPGKKPSAFRAPSLPRAVAEAIDTATTLVKRRRYDEALELLHDLDRRFPNNFMVLQLLAEAAYDTHDANLFLDATERLVALSPDDPDFLAQRAFAHANMGFPFLAQRYFQQVVQRWPEHPKAEQSRQTLLTIEDAIAATTAEMEQAGFVAADAPELGARHEQVQVWLARSKFSEARRVAVQLLSRWPTFPAAHNNLAEAWFHDGNLAQAIQSTRQALAAVPSNVHAQANLVRFLALDGKLDEARAAAAVLQSMPSQRPDNRLKKAEALAVLGDDAGVLAVWAEAEQEGFQLFDFHLAFLHHLAAVAAWYSGDEKRARALWAKALTAMPTFPLARDCIDDLDEPPARRNGPHSASLQMFVPRAMIIDLARRAGNACAAVSDVAVRDELRKYLQQQPQIAHAIPLLLRRGDAAGREFAVRLCGSARTPELLAHLREFALSQNGPDRLREQAAFALAGADELPGGEARLWLDGEWKTQRFAMVEVTREAPGKVLPPRAQKLLEQAFDAMHQNDGIRAEQLVRQALAVEPGNAPIRYNLCNALRLQGRGDEARAIIEELRVSDPDYLFAAADLAREHVRAGEFDEAMGLVQPFLARPRLHTSEFRVLAILQLEMALAKKDLPTARSFVPMLEAVVPNDPQLPAIRKLVGLK